MPNCINSIKIFHLLLCLIFLPSGAQEIVKTSGTAQVELLKTQSRQQVENVAKDLATINALEKAYGRVIIQGNSTYLTNVTSGEKQEVNSVFNMIANTTVKGEVVEVLILIFQMLLVIK